MTARMMTGCPADRRSQGESHNLGIDHDHNHNHDKSLLSSVSGVHLEIWNKFAACMN